jgi:hypothetical protein
MCGMKSSRKGNVKRHILGQHNGLGEPLDILDYMIKVQMRELPTPSYHRPSGIPSATTLRSPSDILTQHSVDKIDRILAKVKQLVSSTPGIRFRARVCTACLTHKLLWHTTSDYVEKPEHECDMSWLMDNPNMTREKTISIGVLNENIPTYLTSLVTKLRAEPIPAIALEYDPPAHTMANVNINQTIIERLKVMGEDTRSQILIAWLQSANNRILDSVKNDPRVVKLSSTLENKWIANLCRNGKAKLTPVELMQFFRLFQATIGLIEFQSRRYALMLIL